MRHQSAFIPAAFLALALTAQNHLAAEDIRWRGSLAEAQAESVASQKPLLMHFTADWCRPCKELNRFVLSSEQLAAVVNRDLVPVQIDMDSAPDLVREYGITSIPCDVFLAADGKLLLKCSSGQTTDAWIRTIERAVESHRAIAAAGPEGQFARRELDVLHREWESRRAEAERAATSNAAGEQAFQLEAFHMQSHFASTHPPRTPSAPPADSPGASATAETTPLPASPQERIVNENVPEAGLRPAPLAPLANTELANQANNTSGKKPQTIGNPWVAESAESDARPTNSSAGFSPDVCLDGLCPVTLLAESRVVKGDPSIGCVHRGRVYFFADQGKQQQFLAAPDRWSPLLAGFDPVHFSRDGKLVPGLRKHGVFMATGDNQAIVLFASDATRQEFQANPQNYLATIEEATDRASQASR